MSEASVTGRVSNWFGAVVGQPRAVAQLEAAVDKPVHAYLFVGPSGSGKLKAAFAFAAALLGDEKALSGSHPDVVVFEREGAFITVAQAREISRVASLSPVQGARKVLVLCDFHLVADAGPALLKTIEEANQSVVFVILAESLPRELTTIASRCVQIDFVPIAESVIVESLVADGVEAGRAKEVAAAAFGDLDRAVVLAKDPQIVARRKLWLDVLARLDGTGASCAVVATELLQSIEGAATPLIERQDIQVQDAGEMRKAGALTATAVKDLEARHKRELRRFRTDELRYGFATIAQQLSARLQLAPDAAKTKRVAGGLEALGWANQALDFNPNETLLLNGLMVRLTEVMR